MQTLAHRSRQRSVVRSLIAALAVLSLLLAGCGRDAGGGAGDSGATPAGAPAKAAVKFDPALRDAPCNVVTAATVAAVFGMPVDEIEQHASMGMCIYNWKGNGQTMDATIHVTRVSDTAAEAAEYFSSATRGVSGAELDKAMASIAEQARDSARAGGAAAEAVLGAADDASRSGSRGLEFRDVAGIGDQARMQVGKGDLSILYGNLHFSVTAFHGDVMPAPDNFNEIVAASRAWLETTLPQREEQTLELAQAAIAAL